MSDIKTQLRSFAESLLERRDQINDGTLHRSPGSAYEEADGMVRALLHTLRLPDDGLRYSSTVRGSHGREVPPGWDENDWHRSAILDSGTSYSLHGRLYVIQCEWCPAAFAGTDKAEAMALFREHEATMLTVPKQKSNP